ncbi:tetratricopeptide repeat protein [Planctomycetota bacterium]
MKTPPILILLALLFFYTASPAQDAANYSFQLPEDLQPLADAASANDFARVSALELKLLAADNLAPVAVAFQQVNFADFPRRTTAEQRAYCILRSLYSDLKTLDLPAVDRAQGRSLLNIFQSLGRQGRLQWLDTLETSTPINRWVCYRILQSFRDCDYGRELFAVYLHQLNTEEAQFAVVSEIMHLIGTSRTDSRYFAALIEHLPNSFSHTNADWAANVIGVELEHVSPRHRHALFKELCLISKPRAVPLAITQLESDIAELRQAARNMLLTAPLDDAVLTAAAAKITSAFPEAAAGIIELIYAANKENPALVEMLKPYLPEAPLAVAAKIFDIFMETASEESLAICRENYARLNSRQRDVLHLALTNRQDVNGIRNIFAALPTEPTLDVLNDALQLCLLSAEKLVILPPSFKTLYKPSLTWRSNIPPALAEIILDTEPEDAYISSDQGFVTIAFGQPLNLAAIELILDDPGTLSISSALGTRRSMAYDKYLFKPQFSEHVYAAINQKADSLRLDFHPGKACSIIEIHLHYLPDTQTLPGKLKAWARRELPPAAKIDTWVEMASYVRRTEIVDSPDMRIEEEVQTTSNKNTSTLENLLSTLESILPESTQVLTWKMQYAFTKKEAASSMAAARALLKVNPDNAMAHYYLGLAEHKLNSDYVAADAHFAKAWSISPENPKILGEYAYNLFKLNRFEKALVFLDRIAKIQPDLSKWPTRRGIILMRMDRNAEAEKIYRDLLKMGIGNRANKYYNLACALARQDKLPEALEYLKLAVQDCQKKDKYTPDRIMRDPDFDNLKTFAPFLEWIKTQSPQPGGNND